MVLWGADDSAPLLSSRGCIQQSSRQRGRQPRQVPDCGAPQRLQQLRGCPGLTQTGNHIAALGGPDLEVVRSAASITASSSSSGSNDARGRVGGDGLRVGGLGIRILDEHGVVVVVRWPAWARAGASEGRYQRTADAHTTAAPNSTHTQPQIPNTISVNVSLRWAAARVAKRVATAAALGAAYGGTSEVSIRLGL